MSKKISGCIVTYNNIKTIDRAIGTLLKYTSADFQLYIVDNGSTDGTVQLIKEKYPNVILIENNTNLGFGKGHNIVLDMLSSDYHCIINPDIALKDDAVSNMADYLDEHSDIGLLSPNILFHDGREQILGKRLPYPHYLLASRLTVSRDNPGKILKKYCMLDEDLSKPIDVQSATGCFMFIRTALFKQLGGFDDRYFLYFEDYDLTRKVNTVSRAVYYPYACILHEWGRDSKRNTRLMLIHLSSMLKYYKKWMFKK